MNQEAQVAALREALLATLQSHQRMGKAAPCDCSLCEQIRDALKEDAGSSYRRRLREECAQVADWVADQTARLESKQSPIVKVAREIGARIRLLDEISH